ncbi:MAG: VCBS domain-containing protein [Erythrobacter sp.]|nr:VCBS domain-containing protein [Erythrobacter sp.]
MNEELGAFEGESYGTDEGSSQASFASLQLQSSRQATQFTQAAAGNVVVLNEGQAIERLEADGPDLVIILTDGSRIVVPDGIILVPQIIVDGTPIPPANVAALLVGNEPEPAAGPNPSSGGNFAVDPGAIQAAFDLGDLLPYTELPIGLELEEEVIPVPVSDDVDNEVTIFGLDNDTPEAVLDEGALANGSDGIGSLNVTGTFGVDAPDGLASVQVNGVNVVAGGAFAGPVEIANNGIFSVTITGWTPVFAANGTTVIGATFDYSVTLLQNTIAHPAGAGENSVFDSFTVVVTDTDGSDATASLDVRIIDDVPVANADTDSVTEDGPLVADGNVLTGSGGTDANASDGVADVQGADGAMVSAVAFGATTGTLGSPLAGAYGSLTLSADGSYSYVLDNTNPLVQALADGDSLTEVFSYTITDGDGDSATTTLTITINGADDGVVINGLDVVGGEVVVDEDDLADGSSPDPAALTRTGSFTIDSPDGLATVTIGGVTVVNAGVFVPGQTIDTAAGLLTITGFTPDTNAGTVIGGTINYSYLLQDTTAHPAGAGENSVFDSFTVVVTDTDGSDATASLDVRIIDDVPVAIGGTSTGTVDEDGLPGGIPGGIGDVPGEALSATGSVAGLFNFGADGPGSYGFVSSGQVEAAMEAQSLSAGGIDLAYTVTGNTITATQGVGGAEIFSFALNASTGSWTFTLSGPLDHAPGGNENNLTVQFGSLVQATDADGDVAVSAGTVAVTINDDTPVPVVPAAASMANIMGAVGVFSLDTVNGDVDDNLGADGRGGVVFTSATITSLAGQALTSGFAPITYSLSGDGRTLIASKSTDGTEVFRITLEPSGAEDQYVVQISQPIDSITNIDFNDAGLDFVGGNGSWAGFTQPGDNDSRDLLLTPVGGGTVNTNANEGGIAGGNSVGSGEAMRVDYVIDLIGNPVPGGDFNDGDDTQNFDGHYTVNGASALFTSINSASTIRISAFDDNDSGTVRNVGDGTPDPITSIAISFNGQTATVNTSGAITIGGRVFTVTFNNGIVDVAGVGANTRIAAFTADGFNSVEWGWVGGNTFKIGDFGASVANDTPVSFFVPVSVIDGDGDIVSSGNLDVTVNPVAPMLALDLDGDGVEFVGTDAGVTFDLDGNGIAEATAWVGANDGILVRDANGNNQVDGAAEIVFGNSTQDALAALSTFDIAGIAGALDPADPVWASLRVWQDANQNGVVDSGELLTLSSLGITSIATSDDNIRFSDANGEVVVQGTATFTANGTGALAAGTYDLANALVDPIQDAGAASGEASAIGVTTLPFAIHDQSSSNTVSSAIEQRLAASTVNYAALAGMLVGLPVSAAAQVEIDHSLGTRLASDPAIHVVCDSLAQAGGSSLADFGVDALLGGDGMAVTSVSFSGSRSTLDAATQFGSNPLEFSGEVVDAAPLQLSTNEHEPLATAVFAEGPGASDHGMMEALLLLGGEQAALPGAVDSSLADLLGGGLVQQTLSDALGGNFVDLVIDQFVDSGGNDNITHGAENTDHLVSLLSADLSGSAFASAPVPDTSMVDEAAQLALMHG